MDSLLESIKKFKSFFIFPLIIFLAFITRFWKLTTLFHWSLDEEFWSFLAHNVATLEHIPLIGGHIGGTGIYSGPVFVWVAGIVFAVIRSNPLVLAGVVSLIGVFSTFLIIKISLKYFGTHQSYVSGLLYATSVLVVLYERKFWNASLALVLANLILFIIPSIIKKPNFKKVFILGVIVSLAFQAHMTGLVHLVYSLLIFFIYKLPKKYFATFIFVMVISHLPLLAFEVRHDFYNTKALVEFLQKEDSNSLNNNLSQNLYDASNLIIATFARVIFTPALDISDELTLCKEMANSREIPQLGYKLIAFIVLLYSLYLTFKKKNLLGILIWVNIFLVILYKLFSPQTFYPGQLSEYYLLPSLGAYLIIFANLIVKLSQRYSPNIYALPLFLVIINLHIIFNLAHSNSIDKKINLLSNGLTYVGGNSYSLTVTGDQCQIYGYRFLSVYLKQDPVESYVDPILGHLYQSSSIQYKAKVELLIEEDKNLVRVVENLN